jgi:hypothetical protein
MRRQLRGTVVKPTKIIFYSLLLSLLPMCKKSSTPLVSFNAGSPAAMVAASGAACSAAPDAAACSAANSGILEDTAQMTPTRSEATSTATNAAKYALVAAQAKPFSTQFPAVSDRFFIGSDNSIYYDYKRADGSWDLEVKGKAIEAGAVEVPELDDFSTPNPVNVLFPSLWQIKQAQPTRLTNNRVAMFFIDANKNLKVITQLSAGSDVWQTIDQAVAIDTNIEFVFPLVVSSQGKDHIVVVYLKNQDNQQVVFNRTLVDEENLANGFGPVTVDHNFTKIDAMGSLLTRAGADMAKRGVMLVSTKASDIALSNAVLKGKTSAGTSAIDTSSLGLTSVGEAYKDGRGKDALTSEDSFGKSITSKKGWTSPADICANVATVVAMAPIASAGPVGTVLNLGIFSGLQRPKDHARVVEATAAQSPDLDLVHWAELRTYDAENTLVDVTIPKNSDGTTVEWQDLSEADIDRINAVCVDFNEGIKAGTITTDEAAVDAGNFCQDFAVLINIRDGKFEAELLKEQQLAASRAVAVKMTKSSYQDFIAATSAYAAQMKGTPPTRADMQKNAANSLKIIASIVGVVLLPMITLPALMVYGTFKGVRFLQKTEFGFTEWKARTFTQGSKFTGTLKSQIQNSTPATASDSEKSQFEKARALNEYIIVDREIAKWEGLRDIQENKIAKITKSLENTKISTSVKEDLTARLAKHQEKSQEFKTKIAEQQIKRTAVTDKGLLTTEEIKFNQSGVKKNITNYKQRLSNWIRTRPTTAWRGIKSIPGRIMNKMIALENLKWGDVSKHYKTRYANNWTTESGLKQQGVMLGVAVVAGGVASYGAQDDSASMGTKYQSAGEGAANTVVQSPITALEGINGIHSTAGAFCRGDFKTVITNASNMAANMAKGLPELITSALKMSCDGAKALANAMNAQYVGQAVPWLACAEKDAAVWATSKVKDAVNWANDTVAPGIGTAVQTVSDTFKGMWLVDPNTKQEMKKEDFNLTAPPAGTLYCIDPPQTENRRCYGEDPTGKDLSTLKKVSL